ncbi:MAG: hypothetical protein ACOVNY_01160 [Chitinophagaceae bacterium]
MFQNFVPVPAKEEIIEIENYRNGIVVDDSYGVLYTREQILEYVKPDGYFDKLIKLKKPLPPDGKWIWTVGFLFKTVKTNGVDKISFTVVPLKYNTETNQVEDRVDGKIYPTHISEQTPLYKTDEDPTDPNEDLANTGNIYP